MLAIYRREMGAFFTSGVAYVFLAVFWLVSGIFFYNGVVASGTTDTSSMFSSMFYIVLFLIPVLTMKLLSEEKKNRTDQGLLTAPVGLWEIVLGKYFAALTLYIIAESVVFIYAFILNYLGDVVWTPLLGNYVAMIFLGAAFIAVGLFISSLTENQMASAVVSLVVLFVIYLSEMLVSSFENGGKLKKAIHFVVSKLAFYSRYVEFTRGVFSLPSIVFFISAAFLFNFFTVKVLEKRRWS
ncbi:MULTISPECIES: ABC transporter permease subunit [Ruminococcus]|jgi:ABC-2 type transport system permease protein|uniref:ABC-2 type transport system permease protein n=2 Tax=Ruminococcus flavefaciens TaxID=1265 RepID=A0A315XTH8_RUMFL|nr:MULTISPECIES: ABC transporter permease subunit [Ruminococcus]MBQ6168860.1 ABC transporter permease subunit [Ruminococcus sp.]MBR1429719.1 ABC transporter permease subunit [Ruminococcus sp.]PWJ10119.1 ABC-2 type transport system permease protein [Ruminococcus flavefaciens]SSA52073.1 ABC-2 type transport system permease protein [Ruminococcus flavefaciens]